MAAGDVLHKEGTTVTWTDSGGDEELDLGGADGDAGDVCVGSYHDFGVAPRAIDYRLDIFIDGFATTPVIGEQVDIYISEGWDTSNFTGPESPSDTTDGTGDTNRLVNMLGPFPATVHSTTAEDNLIASYEFRSTVRYLAVVCHNNTADELKNTSDAHKIMLTPFYPNVEQA